MIELKLSLNIIYEELKDSFYIDKQIDKDTCCICDLWICNSNETPQYQNEYIYLFPSETDSNMTIIRHSNGSLHVYGAFPLVINNMLTILRRYKNYEKELCLAITKPDPFQSIAEIASKMLKHPLSISNNIFRMIGLAGSNNSLEMQYLDINRQTSPAYLNFILKPHRFTKYMSGHTPYQIDLPADCMSESILRVNCFFENAVRCRICIALPAGFHSTAIVQLSEYLGHVIEQIPLSVAEPFFSDTLSSDSDILESGQPDPESALFQSFSQYVQDKPFYVCRLTSIQKNTHTFGAVWIRKNLENMKLTTPIYLYNNDVILLYKYDSDYCVEFFERLTPVLKEIHFSGFVSNLCQCLSDISECIRQTYDLADLYPPEAGKFTYYEEHSVECLIHEISSSLNLDAWLYKGFALLEQKDAAEHSFYTQTLHSLADNHFIYQDAAAELFLHRNSFKYRINKIEDYLSCNLSDSDLQFFIRLSHLLKS